MKKIKYFARTSVATTPGIYRKINQTVAAINKSGNSCECHLEDGVGGFWAIWCSMWRIFFGILTAKVDCIIIRNDLFMPLLFFPILLQRIKGSYVIIDVPTPISTLLYEIKLYSKTRWIKTFFKLSIVCLSYPWALYASNRIIQYSSESRYFSFGVSRKFYFSTNGIDVSVVPLRNSVPIADDNIFNIIGVGSLSNWHAFDRVIMGIYEFKKTNSHLKVNFFIVGDGVIKKEWQELSIKLGLKDNIFFTGFLLGEELDNLFDNMHLAISSLGLYRKKLKIASDLKSREYTARGIPFVSVGVDYDFSPKPFFVFDANNSDEIINISDVYNWYLSLNFDNQELEILRSYASEKLDFSVKINKMFLNKS